MSNLRTINIKITGLVQGVGFRPFIYRIAIKNNIKGWVDNRNDGVFIAATSEENNIELFLKAIKDEAPIASNINKIEVVSSEYIDFDNFEIVKSKNISNDITDISPDISTCDECLHDMKNQDFRINYPFINCTNCGPRFTIIKDLPYDREKTSMAEFEMCEKCKAEYIDILDRRFHAQPIACNTCGPIYSLHNQNKIINDLDSILSEITLTINSGGVIAIKGIGGFFIACNALDEDALINLRKKKIREKKPFAVMFKNIEAVEKYCFLDEQEKKAISSWQRPIVLLESKYKFSYYLNNNLKTIGAMLPYMPLHYMIFENLSTDVIVLTSGNISDEPIIIDNDIAIKKLSNIADIIVTYNRDIYNRIDDSIVGVYNNNISFLRRARGFTPNPINLNFSCDGILATGAELSNCFCIGKNKQAIMSQHIGDLKNLETLEFYEESISRFLNLYRLTPKIVVSDLHPDYLSTKYAKKLNINHIQVQHHYAHIAACMFENNFNKKVIGVAFDGTGLGTDGNIWGAEFLVCDFIDFERITHFDYIPIPGGDKASKENWRSAIAYLYNVYGKDLLKLDLELINIIGKEKIDILIYAIENEINSPFYSSAGRLFDAIASILNICQKSSFQAEAPMLLESLTIKGITESYSISINETINFNDMIREIIHDINKNISLEIISTKFHNTIVNIITDTCLKIKNKYNISTVALSGGVFQNKYLFENTYERLINLKFNVLVHKQVPANDGGIALGQLALATYRFNC